MLETFAMIGTNLGMEFFNVVLLVAWLGGLIFCAKDFRLGLIFWFVLHGGLTLWMYILYTGGADVDYTYSLVSFLISLVLMALDLMFIRKNAGVVI
jgi:hypothetical protein